MTTQTTPFASDKQVAFVEKLRARVGDDTYLATVKDLGMDADPRHLRGPSASKLIDRLLDVTPAKPATAPVPSAPAPKAAKPITDKQVAYLSTLRQERGLGADGITAMTAQEASAEIDRLMAMPKLTRPVGGGLGEPPEAKPAPAQAPEPADLTGSRFNVSVADGGATYEVVRDLGGFCTVRFVPDTFPGAEFYKDDVLGDEATVSRSNIARLVTRQAS